MKLNEVNPTNYYGYTEHFQSNDGDGVIVSDWQRLVTYSTLSLRALCLKLLEEANYAAGICGRGTQSQYTATTNHDFVGKQMYKREYPFGGGRSALVAQGPIVAVLMEKLNRGDPYAYIVIFKPESIQVKQDSNVE